MTTSSTTRMLAGAGTAALLGMVLAGPALADPAPVQGPPSYNTWAQQVPKQGPPSYNSWPAQRVQPAPAVLSASTGVDIEYAQVAAGALGGALLAGGVAVGLLATTRGRRTAHA